MKTMTRWVMYPAWNYRQEAADNDDLSRQGWQLTHMGLLHSRYAYDEGAVYRYALDFDQHIDDPLRYREAFAEQGWELVNDTFNGWHMFRKRYDPALPEEEYQIYTDEDSIRRMESRWRRVLTALGALELALGLLDLATLLAAPRMGSFLISLASVMLGAALLWGAKSRGRESRFFSAGIVLVPVAVLLLAGLTLAFFSV